VQNISRTTDVLHIYQDKEYIDYDVTAITTSNPSFPTRIGTLRVQWDSSAELIDPINPTIQYPVLKETSTLSFNDDTGSSAVVIRYISQVNTTPASANQGSIILHG
jgi:hypothetical protein